MYNCHGFSATVHLPGRSHSFPDTEVAQDPGQQQAQDELPSQAPDVLNPLRYSQYPSPEKKHTTKFWEISFS